MLSGYFGLFGGQVCASTTLRVLKETGMDEQRFKGKVKWFNDQKGYGFIGTENGPDVFVHHSAIEGKGFRTLKEGDDVEFEIEDGPKGKAARAVMIVS